MQDQVAGWLDARLADDPGWVDGEEIDALAPVDAVPGDVALPDEPGGGASDPSSGSWLDAAGLQDAMVDEVEQIVIEDAEIDAAIARLGPADVGDLGEMDALGLDVPASSSVPAPSQTGTVDPFDVVVAAAGESGERDGSEPPESAAGAEPVLDASSDPGADDVAPPMPTPNQPTGADEVPSEPAAPAVPSALSGSSRLDAFDLPDPVELPDPVGTGVGADAEPWDDGAERFPDPPDDTADDDLGGLE